MNADKKSTGLSAFIGVHRRLKFPLRLANTL
jgi:hypothetical protein